MAHVAASYARNSYATAYSRELGASFNEPSSEDTGKAAASQVPGVLIKPEPEQRVQVVAAVPQRAAVLDQDNDPDQTPAPQRQQPAPSMLMTPRGPV